MSALERRRDGSKNRRATGTTAAPSRTADEQLEEMVAVEQARAGCRQCQEATGHYFHLTLVNLTVPWKDSPRERW